jgi:diguanylate cyclase (GGDEF)-like protein
MTGQLLDQEGTPSDAALLAIPSDDAGRVAALRSYGILDQPPQDDLDAAVRLAAYVCGVPTAAINLIDDARLWQAASFGAEPGEIPRETAMCALAITGMDVMHTDDASQDLRFATSALVVGPVGAVLAYAAAPLITRDGHAIGTVCVYDQEARHLTDQQLALLRDVADLVMRLFEMRRMSSALARAAGVDALTGLANRRSVEQAISAAIARAERGLGTPSVVVIDLDDFKSLNDNLGHTAGDAVLREVADRLTRTARLVDTVARVGGDEFVVLLEHTGGPGATAALARLRTSLVGVGEAAGGPAMGREASEVGASLGIAIYRPGDSVASLISRADAEMYAEKAVRG